MDHFIYPSREDLKEFVSIIADRKMRISKYLPRIDGTWFNLIADCVSYVETTSRYEPSSSFFDQCARLLYKIAKRHELGDGNKRSSVIVVFLFCILNDYFVVDPVTLKKLARRVAKTKGRGNEELIKKRIAITLEKEIKQDI